MIRRFLVVAASLCMGTVACGSARDGRDDLRAQATEAAADAGAGTLADMVEIVKGVADRGRDPAVVALAIGNDELCTGTLVSPQIVLTARHCVSKTVPEVACPADGVQILKDLAAEEIGVLSGDDIDSAHLLARGAKIVAPGGVTLCDDDIALVVLQQPITAMKPLPIRARGPAVGDRVRAVGFGLNQDGGRAGTKLVREHVRVLSVTPAEFNVGEATCQGDSGGPAIDEDTGEIVGVVSRGGPGCAGADVHNIYTRVDTFAWLVDEAFADASGLDHDPADGGVEPGGAPAKKGSKSKPPSDVGGACSAAAECAAGVCITGAAGKYCSRPCGAGDRCPTHFHCQSISAGGSACIAVP